MTEQETPKTRYERQVAEDIDLRLAIHEMRKVYDDVSSFCRDDTRDNRDAVNAAERRYERVAESYNVRVYGQVQEWMREVHDQQALVLALATSGVDVGEEWSAEEVLKLRSEGVAHREMVEVLEVVLMELDGTVTYRQTVRPEYVFGGLIGTEYHGHTLKGLADSPHYAGMVSAFRQAVEGRRVIAYNAPWAQEVLAAESARHGVENPLPGMGMDDCVMLQRSRFAGFFRVSDYEYSTLKLGSLDRTPTGVATTVCDVVDSYRTWSATFPPEKPYDPEGRQSQKERDHAFGWQDSEKAEYDRLEAEREANWEQRMEENREGKRRRRAEELRAEGKGEEEISATLETEINNQDWEDIPF